MKKRLVSGLLAVATSVTLLAGCSNSGDSASGDAGAADAWPKENINFIVTHGAGGDTDYNARLIARFLEPELGVAVAASNVTGSNGSIALTQYKDEKPDGYTFVLTNTAALTGNQATGISDFGYDAFETVAVYAKQAGENILVPADSPYNTLEDLIEASKANPGTIKFGVSTGGGVYIASVIMEKSYGAQFNVIESGDAAERTTALLGGHVDATIVPYSGAKEYLENGDVKSLATLLEERPTYIPDIPTAKEQGFDDLILNTCYAILAPKGTDPAVVKAMNDAVLKIVEGNAEYAEEVKSYNLQDPWALNVDDSKAELQEQTDRFMTFTDYLK